MVYFFNPPPKYPRDHPTNNINSDISGNGYDTVIVVNYYDGKSKNYTFLTHTSKVNIVRTHMVHIQVTKVVVSKTMIKTKNYDKNI